MPKKSPAAKDKKPKPLSQQHKRFIAAYRRLRNATRAYLEVYPNASHATANSHGPALLADGRIWSEIESLDSAALKRRHMSADEALALTADLARLNIKDYYWQPGELDSSGNQTTPGMRKPLAELTDDQARRIAGYKSTGFGTDLIFRDADKSLGHVLKVHKLLSEKVELTGPQGGPIIIKWDDSEDAKP